MLTVALLQIENMAMRKKSVGHEEMAQEKI